MSLATRCTACGTVFRVVQDQLKVSEGWVRCGRCETVFNALEGLFDLDHDASQRPERAAPAAPSPAARWSPAQAHALPSTREDDAIESRFFSAERDAPKPAAPTPPAPAASRWGRSLRTDTDDDDGTSDFADARFPSELPLDAADDALPSAIDLDAPAPVPRTDAAVPVEPARGPSRWTAAWMAVRQRLQSRAHRPAASGPDTVMPTPSEIGQDALTESLSPSMLDVLTDAAPLAGRGTPGPVASAGKAAAGTPDFVRQAERAARWRRPRVRASLGVAALLLVGLLGVQALVEFRNAFAAEWPASRPLVEALCGAFDCRIEPLQRLSALSVEASGLTQTAGRSGYRLTLNLRNRDSVELATPTVELSVTDAAGSLIARRAIAPADWRMAGTAPMADAAAGRPVGTSLPAASESQLQLLFATDGAAISGYTVELFYP